MDTRRLSVSLSLALAGLALAAILVLMGGADTRSVQAQPGADVIRVATTGTDVPGCGSDTSPCHTIQYAVEQAADR